MKIGCITSLFAGFDLEIAFKHIAWAGYNGAELEFDPYALLKDLSYSPAYKTPTWGNYEGANIHSEHIINQAVIDERRKQITKGVKSTAEKYGLKLYAIQCSSERKTLSAAFRVARDLEVPIITTFSAGISDDEESTRKVIADFRDFAHEAEKWEVKLAVKPHQNSAIYNTATILRLLNEVDFPALGINFDSNQFYRNGDNLVESINKLGKHIIHCHLRDCESRKSRGAPEAQVAGHGEINIPEVIQALKEQRYNGFLSFECPGAGSYELSHVMGLAAEHRGYLFRCLQELGVR